MVVVVVIVAVLLVGGAAVLVTRSRRGERDLVDVSSRLHGTGATTEDGDRWGDAAVDPSPADRSGVAVRADEPAVDDPAAAPMVIASTFTAGQADLRTHDEHPAPDTPPEADASDGSSGEGKPSRVDGQAGDEEVVDREGAGDDGDIDTDTDIDADTGDAAERAEADDEGNTGADGDADDDAVAARFRVPGQRRMSDRPVYEPTVPRKPLHLVAGAVDVEVTDENLAQVAAELVEQADLEPEQVAEALADLVDQVDEDDGCLDAEERAELTLLSGDVPRRPGQLSQFAELDDAERRRVIVRVLCLLVARGEHRADGNAPAGGSPTAAREVAQVGTEGGEKGEKDDHDRGDDARAAWPAPPPDTDEPLPARGGTGRARP